MTPLEAEVLTQILKGNDTRSKLSKALPGLQKQVLDAVVDGLIAKGLVEAKKKGILRKEVLQVTSQGLATLHGSQPSAGPATGRPRRRAGPKAAAAGGGAVVERYYYDDHYYHHEDHHEEDEEDERERKGIIDTLRDAAEDVVEEVEEAIEEATGDEEE